VRPPGRRIAWLLIWPLFFLISCSGISSNLRLADSKIAITNPGQSQLPGGVTGRAYILAFSASGGSGLLTWSNPGATLGVGACTGLSLTTGGMFAAAPAGISGTCSFMAQVTDSKGPAATGNFAVLIQPTLSLGAIQLRDGVQNRAYSQSVSASGGLMPLTLCNTAPALPSGLTISANGSACVISGTPQAPFNGANLTITATDSSDSASASGTANTASSLTIQPALSVEAFSLGTGVQNRAFDHAVAVTGGILPLTQCNTMTPLPAGLTIFANGATCVISGTPQATAGPATITISVSDSANAATASGAATGRSSIQINPPLAISALLTRIVNGMVDFAYPGLTFTATGGTNNGSGLTWTQAGATSESGLCSPGGSVPQGLLLGGTTGLISGVPTKASTSPDDFQFQVCVEDAPTASTAAAAVVSGPVVLNVLNRYAYVTSAAQAIQVIDLASNSFVKSISLTPFSNPAGIAVTPDGRFVFVVDNGTNQLILVNTITNNPVAGSPFALPASCVAPWGVAIPPDPTQPRANRAFISCSNVGDAAVEEVVVLDTANPGAAPLAVIPTGFGTIPTDVVIRKDNSRVYVVLNGTNQMFVIDNTLPTPAAIAAPTFNFDPTTDQPLGIGLAANNGKLYAYVTKQNSGNQVSANPSEGVEVVDVSTDALATVTTLLLTPGVFAFPNDVAVDPAGALVFVTLQGSAQVAVVDNSLAVPAFISGSPFNLPDPSGPPTGYPNGVTAPPSPSGSPSVYFSLFSPSAVSFLTDSSSPMVSSGSPIALQVNSFPAGIRHVPIPK
jgi:DNA-binding beta-propeller fold protein YncE